ncbi:MAG: glycosyltransferase family 2 protein [Rhodospirillales bacterium]|nr:glycosyltransferase family 2 protein [Rhodospirillales bacterium]
MRISVIVTTYNWPEALSVSLDSLVHQESRDFEVIVADDGSTDDTQKLVEHVAESSSVRIRHVWHPDQGFRTSAIRNKAIVEAEGEYIVLIDGDCFVLPDFVSNHMDLAEKRFFVSGKRSFLRLRLTERVLERQLRFAPRSRFGWFLRGMSNQCTRPLQFLDLPIDNTRYRQRDKWEKVQTCNLGFFKTDAIAINGFDERYQGHGLEDSDFVVRLLRAGVARKLGDYSSIVMHLYHPRRTGSASNRSLFNEVLHGSTIRAEIGLAELACDATGRQSPAG